jgi:hypothetical protein
MCGKKMDEWDRKNKFFCSDKCRMRHSRINRGELPFKGFLSVTNKEGCDGVTTN